MRKNTRVRDRNKRKTDRPLKYYKCILCKRRNTSFETLMSNGKPQCLYACLPIANSVKGYILGETEQRVT